MKEDMKHQWSDTVMTGYMIRVNVGKEICH